MIIYTYYKTGQLSNFEYLYNTNWGGQIISKSSFILNEGYFFGEGTTRISRCKLG